MKWISTINKTLFGFAVISMVSMAKGQEPLTLEFWDFPHMPETLEYLQRAIGQFETENPGVKIRYTRLPWQDGQQKVTLSVLSGQPPDICGQVSNNISQFIAQDVLEPLNEDLAPELADFFPSYIDAVSFKDSIYAVPWYKACYVMALNLDVFEQAGVPPPVNGRWTWNEFRTKMAALTRIAPVPENRVNPPVSQATAQTTQYYGLVTNLGPAEYEAYSIIYNFGGRVLKQQPDGSIISVVAEPDFITGLKNLQNLDFKDRVTAPGIGAFTQVQSWKLWKENGTVGTTFQGGWVISALIKGNEEQARANARLDAAGRSHETLKPFRWALAAPPTQDAETTPILASSGLGTFVVFKQKDARRRELAKKFALHLVRGEGQKVLRHECVYPSRISAGNPFAGDPAIEPVFALFPDAVLSPLVPGGERIDRVLQQELQKALLYKSGTDEPQQSAESAARAGHEKIEAVLERAQRRFGQ